jgi:hypothetical protein
VPWFGAILARVDNAIRIYIWWWLLLNVVYNDHTDSGRLDGKIYKRLIHVHHHHHCDQWQRHAARL